MSRHQVTFSAAGRTFDLQRQFSAVLSSDELFDWEHDVDGSTGGVTAKARTFSVDVAFADADVANAFLRSAVGGTGTLAVDGWSMRCSVESGSASVHTASARRYAVKLTAPDPVWRRSTTYTFSPGAGNTSGETLDMPFDMPFDLDSANASSGSRTVSTVGGCSIGVTFFGACQNPYCRVTASDGTSNVYGVDASAAAGERIVIDPTGKLVQGASVYKVGPMGERTNLYDSRRRGALGSGSYVFATMPAGELSVVWPQSYGIDLTVVEERAAFPWT